MKVKLYSLPPPSECERLIGASGGGAALVRRADRMRRSWCALPKQCVRSRSRSGGQCGRFA
eukprot:1073532-Prymnesium_polylepis.1